MAEEFSSREIALSVKGVYKDFLLPHERKNTLKEWVLHFKKPTYEQFHALRDISFEVKKGEFFGIVGRNGSGKSTLLKLIGGIYQPTRGEIKVNGTLTPFIELGIGFNPELTGRENVFLNGAILGLSRKEIAAKYQEIVDFAELEKFMDQKLKNYSSGMQVRLAFSIAMQAHNDILLIDEVLAVGDANFQNKCLRVFEKIKKDKTKTVVFVSHDMESIRRYCDQAIMIESSEIIAAGTVTKVVDEYLKINTERLSQTKPFGVEEEAEKITKTVTIKRVWTEDLQGNETSRPKNGYALAMELEFHAACQNPVPGVILRNQQGIRVTASNSKWIGVKTGSFQKGDKAIFRFRFQHNVLEKGMYLVSANVVSEDLDTFYSWKNDAAELFSEKPFLTGGIINPEYEVVRDGR